jgi:hypothetical protein
MASQPQEAVAPPERRLLIIDFDWQDADLLSELFRRPGVSVRLVAGLGPHDPGVRMADLCGLPRTVDLADLTREIFDLALVGERSSRRTQLESLLVALGTPCQTPEEFLHGAHSGSRPSVEAPLSLHAAALEQSLSGSVESLVDTALPDLDPSTPLEPREVYIPDPPRVTVSTLDDFPSRETRQELEETLKALVRETGAGTAEVHAGDRTRMRLVAQVGPDDRLLRGLIDIAHESGTPQLVTRLSDPGKGRTWAAWPFRTMQRHGVVASASIDSQQGVVSWQKMVEELRAHWDQEDRDRSAASFPLTPNREARWLEPGLFRLRVDLALERHRRDGLRFELHRLEFPDEPEALQQLEALLPTQMRDTDCLSRPFPQVIVLLASGEAEAFARLQKRMLAAWELAWSAGAPTPAPAFIDRHAPLSGPEDADAFLTAADVWLAEP